MVTWRILESKSVFLLQILYIYIFIFIYISFRVIFLNTSDLEPPYGEEMFSLTVRTSRPRENVVLVVRHAAVKCR